MCDVGVSIIILGVVDVLGIGRLSVQRLHAKLKRCFELVGELVSRACLKLAREVDSRHHA